MNILVCIKRVPDTGAKIVLTADQRQIETRNLGFTISPHEECAVEESVQLIEKHGGSSTVLSLGPDAAIEQLRDALAQGIDDALLLATDGREWDAMATAQAIVEAIRAKRDGGTGFDVLLFGNEAADTGDYQVGIRVANALDLPCVTGVKALQIRDGSAIAKREVAGGWEVYEVPLPAVFTLKEGINVPRYPSLRGRMTAKRKEIERMEPQQNGDGLKQVRLRVPEEEGGGGVILGQGPGAAPKVVEILKELGVV
jgi:electron transfer flavoprotein beta subunit